MQDDEFNKTCKCNVIVLNLKQTDANTSYDDKTCKINAYDH